MSRAVVDMDAELGREAELPNTYAVTATASGWVSVAALVMLPLCIWAAVSAHEASRGGGAGVGFGLAVVGCVVFGLAIVVGPILYWCMASDARRIRTFRAGLKQGKYLVRWRYDAGELARWRAHVVRKGWVRWDLILIGFFMVLPPVMLYAAASGSAERREPAAKQAELRRVGWTIVAGVEAALVVAVIGCEAARRASRRRLERGSITVIGTLCAFAHGKWVLWGTAARALTDVAVVGGADGTPARLVISTSNGSNILTEEILVPAGQREVAERVAEAIKTSKAAGEGGALSTATGVMHGVTSVLRMFR
ncbi:MAG TPA: hypothetical protein VEA69_05215 [Tepidisphaeraceae bacterium]|nr:hypothetical protein [Tepidisphaeraceae bacterium]